MVPFLVLVTATLALRAIGAAGVPPLDGWTPSLRAGLSLMFLLTASAHWGKRRRDLIAMVPTALPHPDLIVTITGGTGLWKGGQRRRSGGGRGRQKIPSIHGLIILCHGPSRSKLTGGSMVRET
jgi:hypothetical protein